MPVSVKSYRLWIAVAALVGVSTLLAWLILRDPVALRTDLRGVVPLMLELTVALLVAGFVMNRRGIRESLPGRARVPLGLFFVALLLVSVLPPRTHRIYYDEDIYQNIGQNILWFGHAQMCNEGTIQSGAFDCRAWEYNKEPNGLPFLLSLAYRFTGVDEVASHRLNHLIFALGVVALYWTAGLLFERQSVAIAAAVVYMLTPESLLWSGTIAAEPAAATFGILGVGAWIYFCRRPSSSAALLGAAALAFGSQFRPESGLIFLIAIVSTVLLAPRMFFRRETIGAAVLSFILLIAHFGHMWSVRNENWGSQDAKFAASYVEGNLDTNLRYYVEGRELPILFTLFAVLGLFYPGRKRESLIALSWFAAFFAIFIPFYAGSYRYGADIRFSLVSAAPFALAAGAGIGWIGASFRRWSDSRWLQAMPLFVAIYAASRFLPLVTSVGREAWQARDDHEAVRRMVEELPEDAVLLTHNPGMVHVMGRSASQTSIVTYQPETADSYFDRFPGGVFFQYGFWCNVVDPVQNEMCTAVLARYPTRVILEQRSGFFRYNLYRLLPRSEADPTTASERDLTTP